MKRGTRAAWVLVAVFVAGLAVGAGTMRLATHPRVLRKVRVRMDAQGVYGALDLDARQRIYVDSVLHVFQPRTDSLLQSALPQLKLLIDSADASVRRILTPAQIARLDSMQAISPPAGAGRLH